MGGLHLKFRKALRICSNLRSFIFLNLDLTSFVENVSIWIS